MHWDLVSQLISIGFGCTPPSLIQLEPSLSKPLLRIPVCKVDQYNFFTHKILQNDHSGKFSSKRKTPWMEYDGKSIADSQFCVDFIKKKRNIDLNDHLSPSQKAVGRAFQKLTEENLYWCV